MATVEETTNKGSFARTLQRAGAGGNVTGFVAILLATGLGVALCAMLDSYLAFVLAMLAMNVMVGVGLNILLGLSGQVSFGHIGFFAIGAYTIGILMLQGIGFWPAFLVAGLVSAAVGLLLALPALRVTGPYLAMMTIAFAFIIEHGAIEWRGLTGGANGLMGFSGPEIFGHLLDERQIGMLAMVLAGLSLLFYQRLAGTTWGRAMRAVRDSEVAARSVGLDPLSVKTISFVLSAVLTGLAGALFAPLNMFISPGSFPFFQSILFILAVVVGGAGTLWGPVIGAIIVILLPEYLSDFAEYRLLVFGALLLIVLWAAPRGIVGTITAFLARRSATSSAAPFAENNTLDLMKRTDPVPLEVDGLGISFGGVRAAHNVGFLAKPGEITSIIGPNGAGKTTVLNMISGFYRPDSGTIRLDGDLTGRPAHAICRAGIARTYQTTQLFAEMSVIDNLLIALRRGHLGVPLSNGGAQEAHNRARSLLLAVGYTGDPDTIAGALPHVDKRLVEIARALATGPRVLLLDEPAAGLMKTDKEQLGKLLRAIAETGIAIVLVEHDMSLVMGISDHVVVLDAGEPLAAGPPDVIQRDPAVLRAYLGGSDFEGKPRDVPWTGEKVATLTTLQLEADYGAAPVLEKVSLTVYPGETVAVLGANGAGKSTMMRAIAGLHRPIAGSVLLEDRETARKPAHEIAASGLALVPEGRQVFPELTLIDNIRLGAWSRGGTVGEDQIEALLVRFPRLRDRLHSKAGVLSGGEQQMLAIARGLVGSPSILLLDEPSLGLAPAMIAELYGTLADLRDEGVTILIVDQMANLALTIADRAYLLDGGHVVHEGSAADLASDPVIEQAYLGHRP